jgi:hypothetical protein
MQRLLITTALMEGATGVLLLVWPPVPLLLLLGVEGGSPEALVAARVAGAALIAIAVVCWLGRNDGPGRASLGLVAGAAIYDAAAAAILAHAGIALRLVGIALWPADVAHVALDAWCVACLRARRRDYCKT